MNLPDCITIEEPAPGYPVYAVHHPAATARVALHGAHIMEWAPAGHEPVLYMSPQAVIQAGKPIRGGIPVCWPWFGADPNDASKPMHGIARIRFWQPTEATASATGVKLVFDLTSDAQTLSVWPHAFTARLEAHIGKNLEVSLTTRNTGDTPFSLTEALHTYLRVGDIHQVTVRELAGLPYLDTVGPHAMRLQEGDVVIDREVDRQYASPGPVVVEDGALKRRLKIENSGSNTVVVWNPWIEKSTRLADLPNNDYPRFLCIEAANTGAGPVVEPGAEHVISTRIRVS
ncbi:MAG TPA: D-hexose-6-phosphate mutarotase [Prosthecobacter sp.]|nr:D-hexose-6-phosphate mutarotase [Prosthecobacter sp.]